MVSFSKVAKLDKPDQIKLDHLINSIQSKRHCTRLLRLKDRDDGNFDVSLYNKVFKKVEFSKQMDFEDVIVEDSYFEPFIISGNVNFGHYYLNLRHKTFKNQTLKKKVPMFIKTTIDELSCVGFMRKII